MSAKGLSPCISMYLGIQYASSWFGMWSLSSHCPVCIIDKQLSYLLVFEQWSR
jgi:hypothetical protein